MTTVEALYRYPIKSMQGETLEQATFAERGIPGDRAWAVRDEERGGIRGGKRFAELMTCRARFLDTPSLAEPSAAAEIEFPDGSRAHTSDPDVERRLSALVDSPVTLWSLQPAENLAHYRRGAGEPGQDLETSLRQTFARTPDEPLPDVTQFPPELMEFESPPGTYFDAFPILIMTTASLRAMQQAANERNVAQQFDVRRFRPNVLLAAEGAGFPEREWVGRDIRLGDAVLHVEMTCPRCIMTTHGFADLPRDPGIMRTLVQAAEGELGVYASVVEPGSMRVGDSLSLV